MQHNKSIFLLLALLILFWGLSWPISKIGLPYISPVWYAFLRLAFGTLAMFIITALLGKLCLPHRRDLPVILSIGFFQIGLFILCITIGLEYVEPARSAVLAYTTPLWVTPIAIIFFHEKINFLKSLGLLCGALGIFILVNPWSLDWHDTHTLIGNSLLLLAAISWAAAMLFARYLRWHNSPLSLSPWQLLLATLWVGAIILIFHIKPAIHINLTLTGSLLFSALLATAFGYTGIVKVSKELPVITTSLSMLLVPVVGVFSSHLIIGEQLTLILLIAMIFILAGLVCIVWSRKFER